eukprot:351532-Chlamydomonas_euryale.AAC.4
MRITPDARLQPTGADRCRPARPVGHATASCDAAHALQSNWQTSYTLLASIICRYMIEPQDSDDPKKTYKCVWLGGSIGYVPPVSTLRPWTCSACAHA